MISQKIDSSNIFKSLSCFQSSVNQYSDNFEEKMKIPGRS